MFHGLSRKEVQEGYRYYGFTIEGVTCLSLLKILLKYFREKFHSGAPIQK